MERFVDCSLQNQTTTAVEAAHRNRKELAGKDTNQIEYLSHTWNKVLVTLKHFKQVFEQPLNTSSVAGKLKTVDVIHPEVVEVSFCWILFPCVCCGCVLFNLHLLSCSPCEHFEHLL